MDSSPLLHSPSPPSPPPPPPPPLLLQPDDPALLQDVKKRFPKKHFFSRLFPPRSSIPKSSTSSSLNSSQLHVSSADATPISLDASALHDEDIYVDRYEWAVLYENQRGLTFFSIPYYSSLSLLPTDPSPFTLPNASLKRSKQPPITLDNYPLPDGNWHWVSRCWMIDMRTDSGEVQHDGFEYNWIFRRHNWRAQIGSFNASGWVRRRRWIRLMVRPAKPRKSDIEGPAATSSSTMAISTKGSSKLGHRQSIAASSVFTQRTDVTDSWSRIDPDQVWLGDTEADWTRCRNLMKQFGRDGRKLELWKLWLGFHHPDHKQQFLTPEVKGKWREKQWTEDEGPMPSEVVATRILSKEYISIAPKASVVALLRVHGQHLLHLFVYPESRVEFLQLLGQAGLLAELNVGLGIGYGASEIDFWSYASGLGDEKPTSKSSNSSSPATSSN